MSNCIIGSGNFLTVDKSTVTASSFTVGFPASNSIDSSNATFYRSVGTTCSLYYVSSTLRRARIVALTKTNLRKLSTWRIRMYSDSAGTSLVYDSGTLGCHPSASGFGTLPWGEFDWGVYFDNESEQTSWNVFHDCGSTLLVRKVAIDIDDTESSVDGYVQLASAWVSNGFEPSNGALYGSGIFVKELTKSKEMESGVRKYGSPVLVRGMKIELEIRKSDLLNQLFGRLLLVNGKKEQIVVMLEPESAQYGKYQYMIGNLESVSEITQPYFDAISTVMTILERV